MLAEQQHLRLVDDVNETAMYELDAANIDDVAGAYTWQDAAIVGGALLIGGPLFGGGFAAGYLIHRQS